MHLKFLFCEVLAVVVVVLQGKGIILTSDVGNVRHPYKCRDRTSLLAAFSDLQVRCPHLIGFLFWACARLRTGQL